MMKNVKLSQMSNDELAQSLPWQENEGVANVKLSQMSNDELAQSLPWRKNEGVANVKLSQMSNDELAQSLPWRKNKGVANVKYMFVLAMLAALFGCHKQTDKEVKINDSIVNVPIETHITYVLDGDTARHSVMQYFDFDTIGDLQGFFHELSAKHPIVKWMGDEDEIDVVIDSCIAKIDAYRKGKIRFYPDSLVRKCINNMGFNIAAVNNHSSGMMDFVLAEWLMMCAAYYSPDITCLVETQTPDHRAGFYNFGSSYNYAPWWSYCFIKREKGYQVFCLGDYVKVRSIFQLTDEKNRKYYLCSNSLSAVEFYQCLFWAKDDDTILRVAECKDAPRKYDTENLLYYFDPKLLIWKYAKEEEGSGPLTNEREESGACSSYPEQGGRRQSQLIAIDDVPALRLILDGENSCFAQ